LQKSFYFHFLKNDLVLGGVGSVVEIDEALLAGGNITWGEFLAILGVWRIRCNH
jgi:hypothetical protein